MVVELCCYSNEKHKYVCPVLQSVSFCTSGLVLMREGGAGNVAPKALACNVGDILDKEK